MWSLLLHAGKILAFLKAVQTAFDEFRSTKKLGPATIKVLISALEDLLFAEVIQIPGIPDQEIATALQELEQVLTQ